MVRRRIPPLNALRAFEASARHGSFAIAANELNVTAAAVSQRIKSLEDSLDIALFVRRPRGVVLTEAGRRYRDSIGAALALIERATAELEQPAVDGPLTLSMPQSFATHWLAPRLGRLVGRYPGLELRIEADSRLADLKARQADVGIRFGTGGYAGLHSEYLLGDALSVLAPFDAVQTLADTRASSLLRDATLLVDSGIGASEPWSGWPPWLREAGLRIDRRHRSIRFPDSGMALQACRASAGLCIGRMSIAFEAVRQRELHVLFPWRSADYAYYLVTRPADRENPRIAAFRGWLVEEIDGFIDAVRQSLGVELGHSAGEDADRAQ